MAQLFAVSQIPSLCAKTSWEAPAPPRKCWGCVNPQHWYPAMPWF